MIFPRYIAWERFVKQGKRCGYCRKRIYWPNFQRNHGKGAFHAHHIDGDDTNNFLSNCVCLCVGGRENCHMNIAHGGDYASDYLAPRSAFVLNE